MSKQQSLPVLVGKDSVLHPDGSNTLTRTYFHENNVCRVWEFKPKGWVPPVSKGGVIVAALILAASIAAFMFLLVAR